LVFHSSTIAMMHSPINISDKFYSEKRNSNIKNFTGNLLGIMQSIGLNIKLQREMKWNERRWHSEDDKTSSGNFDILLTVHLNIFILILTN